MPILLRRTTRFAVRPGSARGVNGYAGSPAVVGLTPYVECTVTCRGEPDAESGYLINIKAVDDAVHRCVVPLVEAAAAGGREGEGMGALARRCLKALGGALPVEVAAVELGLSPYHAVTMNAHSPSRAIVRVSFDFAASHRLHVPDWEEAANREYFGKCNNPNGHGHNYRLEVRVAVPASETPALPTDALERIVQDTVIARFDHKHLNRDTEEFADRRGAIPTVENIARVCYELLRGPVAAIGEGGAELESVEVWETDRTSSRYPA